MKTIDEIRRDNLQLATDRIGTAAELAERAKVSASYLSQIKNQTPESKTGKPKAMGADVARKIEKALGEREGWMDVEHNSALADISNTGQGRGLTGRSTELSTHNKMGNKPRGLGELEPARMGRREVPVISFVQAGMMTEAIDPYTLGEGFETILTDVECSDQTFALRIKGKSMLPRFEPGDIIVVDPNKFPVPGQFVVAKNTEEEATFKKYKALGINEYGDPVFELLPLNEDFATLHSERDHLRIVGVAIEHRKPLLE
jgi:SOS-response transcriptional repressor LexA